MAQQIETLLRGEMGKKFDTPKKLTPYGIKPSPIIHPKTQEIAKPQIMKASPIKKLIKTSPSNKKIN